MWFCSDLTCAQACTSSPATGFKLCLLQVDLDALTGTFLCPVTASHHTQWQWHVPASTGPRQPIGQADASVKISRKASQHLIGTRRKPDGYQSSMAIGCGKGIEKLSPKLVALIECYILKLIYKIWTLFKSKI